MAVNYNNLQNFIAWAKKDKPVQPDRPTQPTQPTQSNKSVYIQEVGDWKCACGEMNFKSRTACRKCKTAKVTELIVKKEEEQKESDNKCVICMDGNRIIAIKKCGHLLYCNECSKNTNIKSCPVCRVAYTQADLLRIYDC